MTAPVPFHVIPESAQRLSGTFPTPITTQVPDSRCAASGMTSLVGRE
jgi:hypothetical protein